MRDRRGLPYQPFFYTVDQVAAFLNLTVESLTKSYLFRVGEDRGVYRKNLLRAVDLCPVETQRDWRVAEAELIRWLRYHNLYLYDPDSIDVDPEVMAEGYSPARMRPEPVQDVSPGPPTEEDVDGELVDL